MRAINKIGLLKQNIMSTTQTNADKVKQYLLLNNGVTRRDLVRFIYVDCNGGDPDYFEENKNDHLRGYYSTGIKQWTDNGTLVKDEDGKYRVSKECVDHNYTLYQVTPSSLQRRLENSIETSSQLLKERNNYYSKWRNERERADDLDDLCKDRGEMIDALIEDVEILKAKCGQKNPDQRISSSTSDAKLKAIAEILKIN
jgi:hypothetical protein